MPGQEAAPGRVVLTEQVQVGVVENQKSSVDCGGKGSAESGLVLGVKLKIFLRFSVDIDAICMIALLEQQPAIERHDRNSYSVMLKLFRPVECDDEATAQTEFVTALRKAAKLPLSSFCITEGC